MLRPFSPTEACSRWAQQGVVGKHQGWEFSCCKLHFSEVPRSGDLGSSPIPCPSSWVPSHDTSYGPGGLSLHLSSVLSPWSLVQHLSPTSSRMGQGRSLGFWNLEDSIVVFCSWAVGATAAWRQEVILYRWFPFAWCCPKRSPADLIRAG